MVSPKGGFISKIDARIVGETSVEMGAGRIKKEDRIDHTVGILVHKKVGDKIHAGEEIFTLHAATLSSASEAQDRLKSALVVEDSPCNPLPLFYDRIE
jgi:pyrimidine-nucleoside phosphorylase